MPRLWGMDVFFVLNGVTFLWNEKKARINPSNHDGITFQQAVEAFFDPFLVVVDASRNDEERDAVIGLDRRWNLLYVVYIERENDIIRIISARKATHKEREYYES
ncbi:MAG: BrnT family toxin [Nostoc sp.]|uniref:BrnT family toxin n=1 Tax=Nostoc sp. TaxID=1180 RepID=UPI002FFBA1C3